MASLGQWLLESKLVSPAQLEQARRKQVDTGTTLEMALIELKLIKEASLVDLLAEKYDLPKAPSRLHRISIPLKALSLVPQDLCWQYALIPFGIDREEGKLQLAIVDPTDEEAVAAVRKLTNVNVSLHIIGPRQLEKAIRKHYMDCLVDDTDAKGRRFFGYDEITNPGQSPTLGEMGVGLRSSTTPPLGTDLPESPPGADLPRPPSAKGLEFEIDLDAAPSPNVKETKQYPATSTPLAAISPVRVQRHPPSNIQNNVQQQIQRLEQALFQVLALISSLKLTAEQQEKVQQISNDLLMGSKK